FLETHGSARLAVVGGIGLHGHGVTRATVDLDLVTESLVQDDLVAFLVSQGYETLHRSAGYSNHLHADPALGRLDLIYVDPDTAGPLFVGCAPLLRLGPRQALVPRAEHLAAMKIQAIKNDPHREVSDLADIEALLRLPQVDREEIRDYFNRAGLLDRYHALERTL
ncbi:MAG TPA: hypothetical protein VI589_08030, partial [Vicinamibacteria bacterium]